MATPLRTTITNLLAAAVGFGCLFPLSLESARAGDSPAPPQSRPATGSRPNIVWIVVDDMSPNFGCHGETIIQTPNVDRMAAAGTLFRRAFVTAPVCSPCRSALITGCYQTSIGCHHHRSGRGVRKITLPEGVAPVARLMKDAGYYTCVGGPLVAGTKNLGKTDYNFVWDPSIYDGNDWAGRAPDQPFFMQVQLHGGKLREFNPRFPSIITGLFGSMTSPESVTLPPYYPRDPVLLADWAAYLDAVRVTDHQVGEVLQRLDREGLTANTLVFFITDHGISHARGKQFLYDEGLRIPFVVQGPGFTPGEVRDDFAQQIDLAPTTLAAAGLPIPPTMQGRNLLDRSSPPRDRIFAARDRCDETVDHIRCVRTDRFKYIRNFLPRRPHLQPSMYKDGKPIVKRLRELHAAGQLPDLTERLLFAETRPGEELYDLQADPFETVNLAADPSHAGTLADLRSSLDEWMTATSDAGLAPESDEMYDSDMAVYLDEIRKHNPAVLPLMQKNIDLMKSWSAAGK